MQLEQYIEILSAVKWTRELALPAALVPGVDGKTFYDKAESAGRGLTAGAMYGKKSELSTLQFQLTGSRSVHFRVLG